MSPMSEPGMAREPLEYRAAAERLVTGILVGGSSRRMGRDKALLPHPTGGTCVEHVVSVAQTLAAEIVLLGVRVSLPPKLQRLPALPDAVQGAGPLAGLDSLLRYVRSGWALLLSCDLPLLTPVTLARLLLERSAALDAIAVRTSGAENRIHACAALYHTRCAPAVQRELLGERRMQAVLKAVRTRIIDPAPGDGRSLTNVNGPSDLEQIGIPIQ